MVVFSTQVESECHFVTVTQEEMPDDYLHSDWTLYRQVFFQLITSSIRILDRDGSISITLSYVREEEYGFLQTTI